jgi:predicted helicase
MDNMEDYFAGIERQYKTGHAKEHAYRPDLKNLFEKLLEVTAVNDPKRSENGAPDFVLVQGEIIFGYAEAKDIDADIEKTAKGEQLKRYFGYSNLILTNYIDFRFYRNGEEWCDPISIAKLSNGVLTPFVENYDVLTRSIQDFYSQAPEKIRSANRLTKIMGGRARRIRDNVTKYLEEENDRNSDLIKIYEVIKKNLIHDITHIQFADMYAQTLVYGLFVARYHDTSLETFSRQEARDLIPASNPFLQHFFDHLAGANFDKRLRYIVDELCAIFAVSNVKELMDSYKNDRDPVIHFYEDFLFEYDNDLRKKMGVFYTPAPVVSFIVRAVDEILKKDFGLVNGIADTSKVSVEQEVQGKKKKVDVHRVQVLDPATGTGTFLNEIIKYIHVNNFSHEKSLWNSYVNKDLLPRLHGFELMMASYTIAHLKLAMTLRETGVEEFKERIGVYLTNSLEEAQIHPDDLFGSFGLMDTITKESSEASRIKSEYPVMVVVGNPPYSISSSNKGEWIQNEIKEYKKDLNERNIQPLSDDYIKFIRFSEYLVEKNKEGVVAMITNNSFIDGIIHRQMRKHLLETFDDIYIMDLHGNARKNDKNEDGSKDENVFNIMAGVSINIFVKNNKKKRGALAKVFSYDLQGLRKDKFEFLDLNNLESVKWNKLEYKEPNYFFVKKDFSEQFKYEEGFRLDYFINQYSSGVKTHHDSELISFESFKENNFLYYYKPFDIQYINYDLKKVVRARELHTSNYLNHNNLGLILQRGFIDSNISSSSQILITKIISDINFLKAQTYNFPLYLYSNDSTKIPNLDKEIWGKINEIVGETTPENILDYIYAVLHSPKYRETYKEFLKIDFPCVPYPKNKDEFWNLVPLGTELREFHLLEAKELESFNLGISFIGDGEVIVEKPVWSVNNRVYVNKGQYFDGIEREVFDFYIGGYQPAQKWLKDRKGRVLTSEDIIHYKKMCVAMKQTIEIMKEVDSVIDKCREL